jgi:hypothetical protein
VPCATFARSATRLSTGTTRTAGTTCLYALLHHATVPSTTTAVCTTVPLHTAAKSTVSLSSPGGVNFSVPAPGPRFVPAFDWAVGRAPWECAGQIVYTPAASLTGKNIHAQAWLVPNRSDNVSSGGAAISIVTGIVLLSTTITLPGDPGVLNFTFGKVTALCLAIYITLADGRSATCTSWSEAVSQPTATALVRQQLHCALGRPPHWRHAD